MSRTPSQVNKVHHGSYPGTTRADEESRKSLPRPPILIAPRPSVDDTLGPDEIRLMEISPSEDRTAPIRALLRRRPLRCAAYEALSPGVRENEELQARIEVNEQPLSIGGNLLEALRGLRYEDKNRTLWVDSICVNQNDIEEKGYQSRLRAKILEQATAVIPWPWDRSPDECSFDETGLTPWLIPGSALGHPSWNSAVCQAGDMEREPSLNFTDCQTMVESPPALTSSPKSPQTTSPSSSPGFGIDPRFQAMYLEATPYQFSCDIPFFGDLDGLKFQQLLLPDDEVVGRVPNTSDRKRPHGTAFSDELSTPRHRKAQNIQPLSGGKNEGGPNVVFACPFHRSDPQKYHRCLKYTLNRIKDVKQHMYRQHSRPTLYCARCYKVFNTTEDRDDHSRRADCEKRSPPEFEGITEQQKNELKKSSPKKKPLDEQWFELWDVVFPGRRRPQSAVIRNYVEEMVPLLRNLWNDKQAEIISGVMEARDRPAAVDGGLIASIMSSVFDRFEAETTRSSQGCNTEWPEARLGSPQHTTKIDSGLSGAESCFNFEDTFDPQYLSQIDLLDIEFRSAVDTETPIPHTPREVC